MHAWDMVDHAGVYYNTLATPTTHVPIIMVNATSKDWHSMPKVAATANQFIGNTQISPPISFGFDDFRPYFSFKAFRGCRYVHRYLQGVQICASAVFSPTPGARWMHDGTYAGLGYIVDREQLWEKI